MGIKNVSLTKADRVLIKALVKKAVKKAVKKELDKREEKSTRADGPCCRR